MPKIIHVRRNQIIHLVVGGETKIGLKINGKGHPTVVWKKEYKDKSIPEKKIKYPTISMPGWMKKYKG